jgi:hypothetical protein
MAIVVQTFDSTIQASSSIINNPVVTFNKPTGLTIGDLIVAYVFAGSSAGATSIPSGWTKLREDNISGNSFGFMIAYKIATSTEISASTFSFGTSTNANYIVTGGFITRITGHNPNTPIFYSNYGTGSGTNPSINNGITPLIGNELLLLTLKGAAQAPCVSGYAITTDNPTWTEQCDISIFDSNGASGYHNIACATATRSQTTSTGNSSFTASVGTCYSTLIGINPSKDTIISESIVLSESLIEGYNALKIDIINITDSVTTSIERVWTKLSKPVSTWINKNKS